MELRENITGTRSKSTGPSIIYTAMKRLTDILVSFTFLLLLLPLMIFICYKIYKKEGKPIFYREVRVGKDNRKFIMCRFRTMTNPSRVIHALPPHPIPSSWEDGVPDKFTFQRDDYVTVNPTGAWLRKYKLHKLPLLWNVLKGDMSLVGPKPEIPEIVDFYNEEQKRRLTAKPGITGYAQIKPNPAMNHRIKIHDDIYYIKNRSYWMDVKILLRSLARSK